MVRANYFQLFSKNNVTKISYPLFFSGSFRISPGRLKKKLVQLWRNRKTYDDRILVVGNKFSEHLFRELNIDLKKVQTGFSMNKKANIFCTSKYTPLTFLPLNLYEQFRRISNFYFLMSLVFAFIFQNITPVSPNSWAMSLIFVVAITMLKQGYEDYLRHKSDK